jgi:GTP cyclohydrolase I
MLYAVPEWAVAEVNLTWDEIDELVRGLAARLPAGSCCWGVPRGGSVVASLLRSNHGINITADWTEATVAVDDIIDSGRTARYVWNRHGLKTEALVVKETTDWIVFPWEGTELSEDAENTVTRFLQQIGENPNRRELERMPRRVVNYWERLFSGYRYGDDEIAGLLRKRTTLSEPVPDEDGEGGMVVLPGIPYVSSCEKHLLPFFGTAYVGYIEDKHHTFPGDVPTLVYALSRRLQIQDRLTGQICESLHSGTEGTAVRLVGNYLCPMVQGRFDRQAISETTAFAGKFEIDLELQNRFLSLCRQEASDRSNLQERRHAG